MKILVTGAAGFIGYHLVKALLERGDQVVGLDNINDYYDTNLKYARLNQLGIKKDTVQETEMSFSHLYTHFKFIKINLINQSGINKLFLDEKFDTVCNLAAQAGVRYSIDNPHAFISSNIVGFINILEACKNTNVKNFLYASSSSVYGSNETNSFQVNDNTDSPISVYAATKKSNELLAHSYSYQYHIRTTGLRFFTVYGPWGRPDMAPMIFAKSIQENRPINIFNEGNMSRDFTYIDDVIESTLKVIDKPITETSSNHKIYNIGNSKSVKLLDFIDLLETNFQRQAIKNYLPMQSGDLKATHACMKDFSNDFNYIPETSIEQGVKLFTDWYKDFFKQNGV